MPWSRVARAKLTSRRTDRSQLPVLSFPGCQKEMRGRSQTRLRPLFRLNRFAMDFISMRASARTRVTFDYEIHPCISPFGPTASPLFKFAPGELSRQKSPKPFALPCMDAPMPRRHGWRGAADAQPFGFPRVLGQTGEAVNSLRSDRRPLVSCLPCAARLCVSRNWWSLPFVGATTSWVPFYRQ